jgi:putative phosphoribosyl transferase
MGRMRSMPVITFQDRRDAGRRLGGRLRHLRGEDMVVLGLPRGGVPVAFEVARALKAPLDLLLVRKLGVPFQRELAMGAVGEGGITVYNEDVLRAAGISPDEVEAARSREMSELSRRADRYRAGQSPVDLTDRVAVIIDDGIATGATARAACLVARARGARRVVLAAPVGARDSVRSGPVPRA